MASASASSLGSSVRIVSSLTGPTALVAAWLASVRVVSGVSAGVPGESAGVADGGEPKAVGVAEATVELPSAVVLAGLVVGVCEESCGGKAAV